MRRVMLLTTMLLAFVQARGLAQVLPQDNFDDSERGHIWTLYQEHKSTCWVEETHGRLEVRATSEVEDRLAGYFPRRWTLDPADDFTLRVDWVYNRKSTTDGWVFVMLTPDPSDPRRDHLTFDVGCEEKFEYVWYKVVESGSPIDGGGGLRIYTVGTFYVSYNSAADEVYLSRTGYGEPNALWVVPGVLKGKWGGLPVCVGIGGGSDGTSLDSGQAHLDNFAVESGTVLRGPAAGQPTAGAFIVHPITGSIMAATGYTGGTLEFRDWQGDLLAERYDFGEITVVESHRFGSSPLPRLLVGSAESGGTLHVIDPTDIHTDLASRSGLGRVTALWPWGNGCLYVGSADLGGALHKVDRSTLADQAVRYGFGEITAFQHAGDSTSGEYLLVGSTDSGGALRCLDFDTLADASAPRYGFGRIYSLSTGDADWDGNAEIVIASSDDAGTLRFVEAPNLATDLAARYGFGTVYDVAYKPVGITQGENEGQPGSKVSIVVASSDGGGAVRLMEVDADTLATTLADSAVRFGFNTIAAMGLGDTYLNGVNLIAVISADRDSLAAHIMDENLLDLSSFWVP